jgi:hypothetical protein
VSRREGGANSQAEVKRLPGGLLALVFRTAVVEHSINLTPDEAEALAAMLYFNAHKQRLALIDTAPGRRYHA